MCTSSDFMITSLLLEGSSTKSHLRLDSTEQDPRTSFSNVAFNDTISVFEEFLLNTKEKATSSAVVNLNNLERRLSNVFVGFNI